jgi:hypothetical protein
MPEVHSQGSRADARSRPSVRAGCSLRVSLRSSLVVVTLGGAIVLAIGNA